MPGDNVIELRGQLHPFDTAGWVRMARNDPAWAAHQISGLLSRALLAELALNLMCEGARNGHLSREEIAWAQRVANGTEFGDPPSAEQLSELASEEAEDV